MWEYQELGFQVKVIKGIIIGVGVIIMGVHLVSNGDRKEESKGIALESSQDSDYDLPEENDASDMSDAEKSDENSNDEENDSDGNLEDSKDDKKSSGIRPEFKGMLKSYGPYQSKTTCKSVMTSEQRF